MSIGMSVLNFDTIMMIISIGLPIGMAISVSVGMAIAITIGVDHTISISMMTIAVGQVSVAICGGLWATVSEWQIALICVIFAWGHWRTFWLTEQTVVRIMRWTTSRIT